LKLSLCPMLVQERVESRDLSFKDADKGYFTHNFHSYPAKFIPRVARWVIERYSNPSDLIVDPMCGSGTAFVESLLTKRRSIGVDIDPLACLITRAKVTPIDTGTLDILTGKLLTSLKIDFGVLNNQKSIAEYVGKNSVEKVAFEIPNFYRRDELFRADVQSELAIIRARIMEIEDEDVRNFSLVAFSSILRPASN